MEANRLMAGFSALLAVASMALALYYYEGIMVALSVFSLVYGVVAFRCREPRFCLLVLVTTVVVAICTVLSVTVLSQEGFLTSTGNPTTTWTVLIGFVHTIPVITLTLATYLALASMCGASFNWALVRGLSPFIGMGIEVPGFVLEYIFQGADNWMTDNGYILYHFLITAVVLFIVAYLVSAWMRNSRTIIAENGMEELKC